MKRVSGNFQLHETLRRQTVATLARAWPRASQDFRWRGHRLATVATTRSTQEHASPIVLHQERTENYYATRYGTPEPAERMVTLLQAAVPELGVLEVEE